MSQSRTASSVEAATNTVVGFGISCAATLVVLPAFGSQVTPSSGFGITCVFAALSYVRGYVLRRLFNRAEVDCGR